MTIEAQARLLAHYLLSQSPSFDGRGQLLAQVDGMGVSGGPVTMLELVVDEHRDASPFPDGPIPGFAVVSDDSGGEVGTLLLWVSGGYLSLLEFGWVSDVPPDHLPNLNQVHYL